MITRTLTAVAALGFLVALPDRALAQAGSFSVGGPIGEVHHLVDILTCCGHLKSAVDTTPDAKLFIAGPPWDGVPDTIGSGGASSVTTFRNASANGVAITAGIAGRAAAGADIGFNTIRAFASQGGSVYYSFTLDEPSYVKLDLVAARAYSAGDQNAFSIVFELRNSLDATGGVVPGFSFAAGSGFTPLFSRDTLHTLAMQLPAGDYSLWGGLSGDVAIDATNASASFSLSVDVSLSIRTVPDEDAVGEVTCAEGTVEVTPPGGTPTAVQQGYRISMGDLVATGPNSRACLVFVDGTTVTVSQNATMTVDLYVFDPSTTEGAARYVFFQGVFQYISGLMPKEDPPNTHIDTPMGNLGIRGTEFIARLDQAPPVEVYLIDGGLTMTPWNAEESEDVDAAMIVRFDNLAVSTDALTQEAYDALEEEFFGGSSVPDTTPPTDIAFLGGINDGDTFAYGAVPPMPVCTAVDVDSGLASCVVTGYSTSVGTHTLVATATDNAGNSAAISLTYIVTAPPGYTFSGFFAPVDNPPLLNVVRAGATIPVKFSLNGDQGMNILAAGYPASQIVVCDGWAGQDAIEETVAAGRSGLIYDAAADQYIYVWKTEKSWANSCRQFVLTLSDGTTRTANFRFVR